MNLLLHIHVHYLSLAYLWFCILEPDFDVEVASIEVSKEE